MEQKSGLVLLVTLCHFCSLGQSAQVSVTANNRGSNAETILFSNTNFIKFYNYLCKNTTSKSTVKYNTRWIVTEVKYSTGNPVSVPCNYYRCTRSSTTTQLQCNRQKPSCNGSENYQSIEYKASSCRSSKCVTFIWQTNESVNYTALGSSASVCNISCDCPTTTRLPISTTTTNTPTESTTNITTTATWTSVVSLATSTRRETVTLEEYNVTSAQHSNDEQTDNTTTIIIGVIIPLVIIAVLAFIVVFVCIRKRSLQQKDLSDTNAYVNLSTSSLGVKDRDTRANTSNPTQHLPIDYSNGSVDNTLEEYANVNTKHLETTGQRLKNDCAQSSNEFVYSQAKSLENINTSGLNAIAAAESIPHNHDRMNYPTAFKYATIENTLDETEDEDMSAHMTIPNTSLDKNVNNIKSVDDAVNGKGLTNVNTAVQQTQNKETISKELLHIKNSKSKLTDPQANNENEFKYYQNIELSQSSKMDKASKTEKTQDVSEVKDKNFKQTNNTVTSEQFRHQNISNTRSSNSANDQYELAGSVHFDQSVSSRPSDNAHDAYSLANNEHCEHTVSINPSDNVDDEYSYAGNVPFPNSSNGNSNSHNVYARLGDRIVETKNPYNVLLQDAPSAITTKRDIVPSKHKTLAQQQSPSLLTHSAETSAYSTAGNIVVVPTKPSPENSDRLSDGVNIKTTDIDVYYELEPHS